MISRRWILSFCVAMTTSLLSAMSFEATNDTLPVDSNATGMLPSIFRWPNSTIGVNGYYRFWGTYQREQHPYQLTSAIGSTALPTNLFIGDDAQLPNLWLNVSGSAPGGARWGFDLRVFQFLNGQISDSYGKQVADSLRPNVRYPLGGIPLGGNLGAMLGGTVYGDFRTKKGQWNTTIGGIQWVNISDLTMASFRGYNRFMLFERNPWDPMGAGINGRYKQYFEQGSIDQDQRWGNRAFQGVVIQGSGLPAGLSVLGLVGKTELNGGFNGIPNFSYGGRVMSKISQNHSISINSINQQSYTDSLAKTSYGLNVHTLEFSSRFGPLWVKGEVGAGRYFSPQHHKGFEGLGQIKIAQEIKKLKTRIEIHAFQIGSNIVNNNGVYWNTSVAEYRVNDIPAGSVGSSAVLQPFGSSMVRVGQMTNNRRGVNFNLETSLKSFKISGGIGSSAEIKPAAGIITVGHPVNQFTRSRFWRWNFPSGVGPYGRYSDIYRDVYQTVNLSDDSMGVVVHKKFFNSAEIQLKYSGKIGGKDFYVFSLFQANSASRIWSPITITDERAYVRQYSSEMEVFARISRTIMITGYLGYERTLGNYRTDISDETYQPLNQFGRGTGVGCDIELSKSTKLYLRHRWYSFHDVSFIQDRFGGTETILELKVFF